MPPAPVGPPDPHGIAPAAARLGNSARKNGKAGFAILGSLLADGEVVEALCVGRFHDQAGLCAVTNQRLVVLGDGPYKPAVATFEYAADLAVQGWADDKVAALVFTRGDHNETIDRIPDRPLAQEIAQRVRGHIAAV
ncbi:MAG TPA: hypothetical protein VMW08_19400 [Acidimicrobiales bacterium]|nr:hypothetical protein [Acidimicrobiales bacterium]